LSDESASFSERAARSGPSSDRIITLGKIVGTFGVQGWVKIQSFTDPPENIFEYDNWRMQRGGQWSQVEVEDGRVTGKGVLAKLVGIDTPEDARLYVGTPLGIARSDMPAPAAGEYYWSDLEGLEARSASGEVLGRVDHFRSTPGGDVVIVRGEREYWIPFVKERILEVDLQAGYIALDWAADW
jgi:16S rRNA processing protein RimM